MLNLWVIKDLNTSATQGNIQTLKGKQIKTELRRKGMTKEMAIMELMTKSQEVEALECCVKILEGWSETAEFAVPLKKKQKELEVQKDMLYDIAAGGKFDIEKAF